MSGADTRDGARADDEAWPRLNRRAPRDGPARPGSGSGSAQDATPAKGSARRRRRPTPVIGVTGPDRGGAVAWLFSAWAVWMAGGRPVRIRPARPDPPPLDGLIIGGGSDVSPSLWADPDDFDDAGPVQSGDELGRRFVDRVVALVVGLLRRLLSTSRPAHDEDRDALESELIRFARDNHLPLLGICRGMQLLNVVHGGTLIHDVRPMYVEHAYVRSVFPRKRVAVAPRSRLAEVLRRTECRVNALHRQAVSDLGEDLEAVAHEATGIVQAIEGRREAFLLGLQWHPELLPQLKTQRRLFVALVEAASDGAEARVAGAPVRRP